MCTNHIPSTPEEREKAAHVIGELRKALPCPCTVPDCPFKNLCDICIRNHRIDGHLTACTIPPHPYREDIDRFPRCRSPLLWILYYAQEPEVFVKQVIESFPADEKEEIHDALRTLQSIIEGIS